jgi:phosphotriesterase-related protein
MTGTALTMSGETPTHDLGVTLGVRALLGLLPGADLAPENDCSMLTSFNEVASVLRGLKSLGVGTVIDRGGMTLGRDLRLYDVLSQQTGVHIVGSTGMGLEEHVGSHFTSPTSMHLKPAIPLQDEELSVLFEAEVLEGMVIPRVRRAARAGVISVAASETGLTDFESKSFRAAAQSAVRTGASVAARTGSDPVSELAVLTGQGLSASRVLLTNIDRANIPRGVLQEVLSNGAAISFDNAGRSPEEGFLSEGERITAILDLAGAGYAEQLILGSDGYGRNIALPEFPVALSYVLSAFVPALRDAGADDTLIDALLSGNPQRLLALDTTGAGTGEEAH